MSNNINITLASAHAMYIATLYPETPGEAQRSPSYTGVADFYDHLSSAGFQFDKRAAVANSLFQLGIEAPAHDTRFFALAPISDFDWQAFAGAESFPNDDRPLYGEAEFSSGIEYQVIIGRDSAEVLFTLDGVTTYGFSKSHSFHSAFEAQEHFDEILGEWPPHTKHLGLEFFVINGFRISTVS